MVEFPATGDIARYNSTDEDNFTQAGVFWRDVLNDDQKERLVDNISGHLCNAQKFIQVKHSHNIISIHFLDLLILMRLGQHFRFVN